MEGNRVSSLFSGHFPESSVRYNSYDQVFAASGGGNACGCCGGGGSVGTDIVPLAAMGVLAGIAVYLAGQLGMMMDMGTRRRRKRGKLK